MLASLIDFAPWLSGSICRHLDSVLPAQFAQAHQKAILSPRILYRRGTKNRAGQTARTASDRCQRMTAASLKTGGKDYCASSKSTNWKKVNENASAASLAVKASNVVGVVAEINSDGNYHWAQSFAVHIPAERTEENASLYADAARIAHPKKAVNLKQPENAPSVGKIKKTGRNDPCPCGSGAKFKKCHGL